MRRVGHHDDNDVGFLRSLNGTFQSTTYRDPTGSLGIFFSGGDAVLSMDAGARATFTFTGSEIRWIGTRDEWSGIARVFDVTS